MGHCGGSVAFSFSLLDHMMETGIIFALLILKQNGHMARNLTQVTTKYSTTKFTVSMHILAVHCPLCPWGTDSGVRHKI